jgi:hypothetical protein
MNLQEFNFPKVNGVDMAFSTFKTIPELADEARIRGFYSFSNKWNKRFSELFFNGGKLNYKDGFSEEMAAYMISFMRSFEPKHQDKEAICAMLLSELEID